MYSFTWRMLNWPKWNTLGGKHRIGLAIDDAFCEMLELANAAARNNGNAYRPGNCASERYIETGLGTVAIHAREQNLARSTLSSLRRPFNRIEPRGHFGRQP